MEKLVEIVRTKIRDLYSKRASHDYFHALRVCNNAKRIAKDSDADIFVVQVAALLHDIGYSKVKMGQQDNDHEIQSKNIAEQLLTELDVAANFITKVLECIEAHRMSKHHTPKSVEAQIVQDADRLDALGAIAVARTFAYDPKRPLYDPNIPEKEKYDGVSDTSINHIKEKVMRIELSSFHTEIAKKIAKGRTHAAESFVKEFIEEWEGLK